MARTKATPADVAESDFSGSKVSLREILETIKEVRGEPGIPPMMADPVHPGRRKAIPAEVHADMRADFSGANLEGIDLGGLDLRSVVFKGCNMKGANLEGAILQGCNFKDADLTDANLDGADLRWAIAPNGKPFEQVA